MSADFDKNEISNILPLSAIAIQGISALSTFENKIDKCDQFKSRIPRHNSALSGQQYTAELLSSTSGIRISECLHMTLAVFTSICTQIRARDVLYDTQYTTVDHQLHMFLFITTSRAANRGAQECFQHSPETVSRIFKLVLNTINILAADYIQTPSARTIDLDIVYTKIRNNPKFFPFFCNYLGAIDGSLIPVKVAPMDASSHRTRKGFTAQNIFIVCSFDCTIQCSLAGWKGSAHDNTVLADAIAKEFRVPTGKYYLADPGYAITPQFLTPYCGVRYHLRQQVISNQASVLIIYPYTCLYPIT